METPYLVSYCTDKLGGELEDFQRKQEETELVQMCLFKKQKIIQHPINFKCFLDFWVISFTICMHVCWCCGYPKTFMPTQS